MGSGHLRAIFRILAWAGGFRSIKKPPEKLSFMSWRNWPVDGDWLLSSGAAEQKLGRAAEQQSGSAAGLLVSAQSRSGIALASRDFPALGAQRADYS
jgi:hypothetical protein